MFIFTGDTRPCQAVADLAKGVDVVVLVCVRINDDIEDMEESSHREGARGAAKLAHWKGTEKLVIVHNTNICGHGAMEGATVDVMSVYNGDIAIGEETMDVSL